MKAIKRIVNWFLVFVWLGILVICGAFWLVIIWFLFKIFK